MYNPYTSLNEHWVIRFKIIIFSGYKSAQSKYNLETFRSSWDTFKSELKLLTSNIRLFSYLTMLIFALMMKMQWCVKSAMPQSKSTGTTVIVFFITHSHNFFKMPVPLKEVLDETVYGMNFHWIFIHENMIFKIFVW